MANTKLNYLQMMEKNYGEQWSVMQTPENIQRSAKRIIKEIAKGQYDYEKQGTYFLDMKFLENLIIGLTNELEINTLNLNACRFMYQYYPQTPNLGQHVLHLEALSRLFSIVLERLNYVKMTGNIGYMVDLPGLMYNDKKHLDII